jgi:hypothetical protein
VEDPRLIVLEFFTFDLNPEVVRLKSAVSKEPFVKVNVDELLKASASDHSAPTPLTVTAEASETPFVVMVLPAPVPVSVIAPV